MQRPTYIKPDVELKFSARFGRLAHRWLDAYWLGWVATPPERAMELMVLYTRRYT